MIATTGDASAKAAAGGSSRRENEEAARLKDSFFVSLMEMPAEQFKSLQEEDARARREAKRGTTATSRRKTAGIVEALDLPEGSVVTRPNSYISVSYLRDLFRCFPWLDLRGIAVMSTTTTTTTTETSTSRLICPTSCTLKCSANFATWRLRALECLTVIKPPWRSMLRRSCTKIRSQSRIRGSSTARAGEASEKKDIHRKCAIGHN